MTSPESPASAGNTPQPTPTTLTNTTQKPRSRFKGRELGPTHREATPDPGFRAQEQPGRGRGRCGIHLSTAKGGAPPAAAKAGSASGCHNVRYRTLDFPGFSLRRTPTRLSPPGSDSSADGLAVRCLLDISGGDLSYRAGTVRPTGTRRENMAVSVLFRIDGRGHIEVVDGGPAPAVVIDTDGQLHAESGIITHAGEDLDNNDLWRWRS